MTFAQYCRLNVHVGASARTVVRKAHRMLSTKGRKRAQRDARHKWLRAILDCHCQARDLYRQFRF